MNCIAYSRQIPAAFAAMSGDDLRAAVPEWEPAPAGVDAELVRHLRECSDCSNDVLWYAGIRDALDVSAYPCLHMAYAAANRVTEERHGVYAIGGIVIGYCPWCGLELNVSAVRT